jgi:thioredoxin 1
MKNVGIFIFIAVCLAAVLAVAYGLGFFGAGTPDRITDAATSQAPPVLPGSTGRVTMIDVGATECIPCKMMAPIMEELEIEYAGIADIIFIDVWKNPAEGRRYNVQTIPTQIFYDAGGKEVFRHVGFLDKKSIVDILTRLGATRPVPELSEGVPNKGG